MPKESSKQKITSGIENNPCGIWEKKVNQQKYVSSHEEKKETHFNPTPLSTPYQRK